MSIIQSISVLLGCISAVIDGTARCNTVKSMTYKRHARASTVRPIHSRRPARRGAV
jgi:hypothetical protein